MMKYLVAHFGKKKDFGIGGTDGIECFYLMQVCAYHKF